MLPWVTHQGSPSSSVHWAGRPLQSHQHRGLLLWPEWSWAAAGNLWGYHRAQEAWKGPGHKLVFRLVVGMWSESSTAHCLFFLVFQKIKQPQFVSAVQTTPVHFRLLFFRVKSYREGKILLGVPNVWGCSKYSCSISMGINAVVISVTCCGQTLSLRSPNYLFIQCFWSLGLLAVWCDQSAPGLCWKGLSKQARCVLVTHPITCATCSGRAQISRKEANEPITLTNVKSRIVKLTLWACSLFSVNVNQSGIYPEGLTEILLLHLAHTGPEVLERGLL